MTILLFDGNNLAVRTYTSKSIDSDTPSPNIRLWKYYFFDFIYKSLCKIDDVTEVIIAIDDRKSWRKLYWNRYKEKRKSQRDKSPINWDFFHAQYRMFMEELNTHLPFKTLQIENAEADDIIAIIAMSDNRNYVVISNDEDYLQLCSENIKVYNPQKMEYNTYSDTENFVVMKSLIGQAKDGIFNIKTPLDWPADKRKPGFGEVSAKKVIDYGYEKWLKENDLEKRFETNRILIDFKKIPLVMKTRIMNTYKNYQLPDTNDIYNFFYKNQFQGYLEDFSSVESKLMDLY